MYTLHPTSKQLGNGRHVAMVNIRGADGHMAGSRTGDQSWLTAGLAQAFATIVAIRFAEGDSSVQVRAPK